MERTLLGGGQQQIAIALLQGSRVNVLHFEQAVHGLAPPRDVPTDESAMVSVADENSGVCYGC